MKVNHILNYQQNWNLKNLNIIYNITLKNSNSLGIKLKKFILNLYAEKPKSHLERNQRRPGK